MSFFFSPSNDLLCHNNEDLQFYITLILQYVILAPWVIKSTYSFFTSDDPEVRDFSTFLIFPFLLWRMIHNQIWISLSRYRTVKGNNRIIDKGLEFDQVDRERNWSVYITYLPSSPYLLNPIINI